MAVVEKQVVKTGKPRRRPEEENGRGGYRAYSDRRSRGPSRRPRACLRDRPRPSSPISLCPAPAPVTGRVTGQSRDFGSAPT